MTRTYSQLVKDQRESENRGEYFFDVTPQELARMTGGMLATRSNLRGKDLSGLDLAMGRFNRSDFEGANLQGANLSRADLGYCNLRDADMRDTIIRGTSLLGADLTGVVGLLCSPKYPWSYELYTIHAYAVLHHDKTGKPFLMFQMGDFWGTWDEFTAHVSSKSDDPFFALNGDYYHFHLKFMQYAEQELMPKT